MGKDLMTLKECAAMLGVSIDTVRRRVKRGQLKAEKRPVRGVPTWFVSRKELMGNSVNMSTERLLTDWLVRAPWIEILDMTLDADGEVVWSIRTRPLRSTGSATSNRKF